MNNSLFWEFRTEEMTTASTICGTMHLGAPECLHHWPRIEQYMSPYERIYTESSLSQEDSQYMQNFLTIAQGTSFQDFVTLRRWKRMQKIFLKYCDIDIQLLSMLRPLFIIAQVQSRLIQTEQTTPLDHLIWQKALSDNKEAIGIETAQEQINILLQLNMTAQYQQLVKMSRNISRTRQKLKALLKAYKYEQLQKLYHMSKSSLGKDRPLLLSTRNEIIADRLMVFHKSQPSFFSFGAGHLAGGKGVLRMLKQKGANVRPLKPQ